MSSAKQKFTAYEKTAILREHLINGVPVSKICEKYGMSPSTVYGWRNKLLKEAPLAFGADIIETDAEPLLPLMIHILIMQSRTRIGPMFLHLCRLILMSPGSLL